MRALFVAPNLPTHGSGGRTRLVNFTERLAKDHELSLVAFAAADQDPAYAGFPGAVFPAPPLRPRPGGMAGRLAFYRDRAHRLPAFALAMSDPAFARAIADVAARTKPDVVQIETTEMGQYIGAAPGIPHVLDLQDVSSRWLARASGRGGTARQRVLLSWEYLKTRRYEMGCARAADAVLVTSSVERDFLSGLAGVDPVEVPNGVDTSAFAPMPAVLEEPLRMVFVGPLTSEANRDGMGWFAREVLPRILRDEPRAMIDVVGARGDIALPGPVSMLGPVDAVQPHLARASVVVVPLRVGSGTRYKILEALSMERAVVSTTIGAEGIGVQHRRHIMLADSPEEFAAATVELLRSPELRAQLGAAGRAHVVPRYDWARLVAQVEETWHLVRAAKAG